MFQKDFILVQLDKFFEALSRISLKIEKQNFTEAEEEINQQISGEMIEYLINENNAGKEKGFHYDLLKFQTELLLLKLKIQLLNEPDCYQLKQDCINALKKLITLKPIEYDLKVHEELERLETGE